MSVVAGFDPTEIRLSDNAVNKLQVLIAEEENPSLRFRVYITGGGCSGFQYGFTFDDNTADDDWIIEREGVAALIDAMSYQYLMGSEIDYVEGLEGSKFVVNNPNATTTWVAARPSPFNRPMWALNQRPHSTDRKNTPSFLKRSRGWLRRRILARLGTTMAVVMSLLCREYHTQYTFAAGARDCWVVTRFSIEALFSQPSKGGGLHKVRINP